LDPVRLVGTLCGLYDKKTDIDRIFSLIDDLEARQKLDGSVSDLRRPQ